MEKTLLTELAAHGARLVAVSKTRPNEAIMALYASGQRLFGENKVQELVQKYETLPKDIEWHLIGHLQRNKVKYVAPFVAMIHSVDDVELLSEIDRQAAKIGRKIGVLLQVRIAEEDTKFGMTASEAHAICGNADGYPNTTICGLMGMATHTDDTHKIRAEFRGIKLLFDALKSNAMRNNADFTEISMGMSDDYKIALEEGSTLVRVGSLLFGRRQLDTPNQNL